MPGGQQKLFSGEQVDAAASNPGRAELCCRAKLERFWEQDQQRLSPWEGLVATGAAGTGLGELRRCCGEHSPAPPGAWVNLTLREGFEETSALPYLQPWRA